MPGNMLAVIMATQAEFQRQVGGVKHHSQYDTHAELADDVRTQTLACIDELMEALHEVSWKPWAPYNGITNLDAFRSELIDAFRFWVNLCHIAGMTPDDIMDGYVKSHTKTLRRVADGYDAVSTKCPGCMRAHDDTAVKCKGPRNGMPAWCEVYGRVNDQGERMEWRESGWCLAEMP